MSKSAEMAFEKNSVEDGWKWGGHKLPTYLGIDFAFYGARDVHLKRVLNMVGKRYISGIVLSDICNNYTMAARAAWDLSREARGQSPRDGSDISHTSPRQHGITIL